MLLSTRLVETKYVLVKSLKTNFLSRNLFSHSLSPPLSLFLSLSLSPPLSLYFHLFPSLSSSISISISFALSINLSHFFASNFHFLYLFLYLLLFLLLFLFFFSQALTMALEGTFLPFSAEKLESTFLFNCLSCPVLSYPVNVIFLFV